MGIRSVRHRGASYSLRFDRHGGRWHVEFARMDGSALVLFVSRDRKRCVVVRAIHSTIEGARRELGRLA